MESQSGRKIRKKYCKEKKEAGKEIHMLAGWLLERLVSEAWGGIFPTTVCCCLFGAKGFWALHPAHTAPPGCQQHHLCALCGRMCNKGVQCQWGLPAASLFLHLCSYSALFRILPLSVLPPRELLKGQGAWPKWTLLQKSIFMILLLAEKQVFDKISWMWMFNKGKDGIISKIQNSWFYQ